MSCCIRDSSGNPFVRNEQKVAADTPTRRGMPQFYPSNNMVEFTKKVFVLNRHDR